MHQKCTSSEKPACKAGERGKTGAIFGIWGNRTRPVVRFAEKIIGSVARAFGGGTAACCPQPAA